MMEITETLAVPQTGGEVIVHIEITDTAQPVAAVPENPETVAVAQEQPRKEEPKKMSQKLSTPAVKPDPGGRPQANGDATSGAAHVAWLYADRAYKESQPQIISDGGKGVSN